MHDKVSHLTVEAMKKGWVILKEGSTITLTLKTKHEKPRVKRGLMIWDIESAGFGNFSTFVQGQLLDTMGAATFKEALKWIEGKSS